jgi:hypothetical protein
MKGSPRSILGESWNIFEVRIDVRQLGSMVPLCFCPVLHDTAHLHSDRHLHLEGWAAAVAFERPVSG